MDDVTRHPDDSTLFDLVEDALDPARAELVRTHLSRCAACAAFVQAARAGAPVTSSAVEPMPEAAAANLMGAVTSAWRERVAGIAAAEAVQDASEIETTPVPVPDPVSGGEFAGYAPTDRAPDAATPERVATPRRRRGRRLVPVLAFVVLGTLAGTSILIGNETADLTAVDRDNGAESESEDDVVSGEAPEAPMAEPSITPSTGADATATDSAIEAGSPDEGGDPAGGSATGGSLTEAPPEPGAGAGAGAGAGVEPDSATKTGRPGDDRDAVSADSGAAAGGPPEVAVPPPADYEEFVDQQLVCIATLDDTQLALPDGRIPTQITQGPFGIYLVCG